MGSSNHADELLKHLRLFRKDDFLCDTIVTIGEKSLRAHGIILAAASPFFQAILKLNTEPGLHLINLSGCEFDVIDAAVQFIYTGRLELAVKYAESNNLVQLLDSLSDLGLSPDRLRGCELVFKHEENSDVTRNDPENISQIVKEIVEDDVVYMEIPVNEEINQNLELDCSFKTNTSRNNDNEDCSDGSQSGKKFARRQPKKKTVPKETRETSDSGMEASAWVEKHEEEFGFLEGPENVSDEVPLRKQVDIKLETDGDVALAESVECNFPCVEFQPKRKPLSANRRVTGKTRSKVNRRASVDSVQAAKSDIFDVADTSATISSGAASPKKRDDLICQTCGKAFGKTEHLNIHLRVHTGEKPYECNVCRKNFSLSSNLKRHMLSHTGEKRFLCDLCGRGFTQKTTLNDHMAVHTKERKHMCNLCGKFLKNPGCLRAHSKRHKLGFIRKKCEGVGHIDVSEDGWKLYQDMEPVVKSNGVPRYVCKICQKDYASKNYLAIHMQYHAPSKPYQCEFCGRAFWRSSHLKMHERYHTGERPFCCTTCGKSFTYAAVLNTHMRLHTGEKPFNCQFCGSSYTQQAHLKAHIRTHTGEKPYSCKTCGKQYRNKVDLRFHLKRNPSCNESPE